MEYRSNQRPRSKSGFSFKSDRSDKSHGSDKYHKPKVTDLHETHEEKHKRHLSGNTKANPNAAMEEAQPIAEALKASTLGSLRAMEHKDVDGSPIPEPDLSNPTRSRWERPLDTIRKFEAQIDGEYKRRQTRTDLESNADFSGYTSRRSSYYGGNGNNRYSSSTANGSGYYAGRNPASPRPVEDPYQPTPIAAPGRNRFGQRVQQDMMPPRPPVHGQGMYPGHSYQQSRDTVNTGYSNSSGEPWGNSTDPSSENSSIERMPAQKQPDLGEQYGFNGFGGNPIAEEYDYNNNEYDQQNYAPAPAVGNGAYYNQNQGAPPVPSKMGDGPPQQPITAAPARRPVMNGDGEKRKSWFKRRFSKD
ncbi:Transcription factor [Neofusicoccum parvum]|nr:Transcription factor [Neofusicoccum parvum]